MFLTQDFLAELITFCYNLQVFCVLEQPTGSTLFAYSAMAVACLTMRSTWSFNSCALLMFPKFDHVLSEACIDAFSYLKVNLRMGYFAAPTLILVLN